MSRLLILALLHACSADLPAEEPTPAEAVPDKPPVPRVQKVDGEALEAMMKAPAPKVRLVNFWATWCGPCIAELPQLVALSHRHPEVEVVLVNVDSPVVQDRKVEPMLKSKGALGLTQVWLSDGDPLPALRAHVADWPDRIPVTTIIDRDGTRTKTWIEALPMSEVSQALTATTSTGAP